VPHKPPARRLAHELGNLLAVIVGQTEYLIHQPRGETDPAEERACLEAIRHAALSGREALRELHRLVRETDPTLPAPMTARATPAAARATPVAARSPQATRVARVLVVDDDPDVLAAIAALIRQVGHDVVTAQGGVDAIEAALGRPLDCLVVDLTMPGVSGLTVSRIVKDTQPDVFVVLVTGDEEACDDRECAAAGVDVVMSKPCDRDALLAFVEAAGARP
jgi:CheY-like chemotaxis protein